MKFKVIVFGNKKTKIRWPDRIYKLYSSARRRAMQIHHAKDKTVSTIWIIPIGK